MQTKPWLNGMSWDDLVTINQLLCQSQKVPVEHGKNQSKARQLWENARTKPMELTAAFDVCKQCSHLFPFTFNNGNTFATVSRQIVEDWIESLPSYEAHLLRTGIGHYVNGKISKQELVATLRHAETTWKTAGESGRSSL